MSYQTEQEAFWAGEFGSEYTDRNADHTLAARIKLFKKCLPQDIESLYEIGANRGLNLDAIHSINPS